MRERNSRELAGLLGAELTGDGDVPIGPDVVIDSRAVTPGCLFVAMPGVRVDGHDFAAAAVEAGAAAVLVSREVPVGVPQLVVADPALALARLATAVVADATASGLVTIGITGSSGKTSTKDLLAQVLATVGETVAPVGSFNNEIGVPLTATRVGPTTRYLVSEMGARGIGHIGWLCRIVPPQVGVVVNIGHAHLGEFGSVETIAQAKGELVEALPASGWAVLNADDEQVRTMAGRTSARLAAFGVDAEPDFGELRVWASDVQADLLERARFRLHAAGAAFGEAVVELQVTGRHQVGNALAAAAVALTQGLSLAQVATGLTQAVARSHWRMELTARPDGLLVVNDAYNANPDSMQAALQTLACLRQPDGRLLAVLGDMLELGDGAAAAHRDIGALAARLGVDHLIAVGDFAADLVAGASADGLHAQIAADREQAAELAAAWLRPPDVVLVKASRGLALEHVAELLLADLTGTPGEG
ncbi:MAG TPA: UDP-N-acetylmuramoyl-tripeptide--D-alanyl-D-alanine ligase [Propionicimonas sp.]|nr:UDP-N-acetylmuramoyl-tripeptide--D-alanyl-D-alanine ligase [Propionicimonas sp.]